MKDKLPADKGFRRRIAALALGVTVLLSVFLFRLAQFQLIDGEYYYAQAVRTVTYSYSVAAARGDIVDRNGNVIATSTTAYNLVLNKLFLPDKELNDTLLGLVGILQTQGEQWRDTAPLSEGAAARRMKTAFGLGENASAAEVLQAAIAQYGLGAYTPEEQRILAGIRYTMQQVGYTNAYPFTLAENVGEVTRAIVEENTMGYTGVELHAEPMRVYVEGSAIPHVLGTIGLISESLWEQDNFALAQQGYAKDDMIGIFGIEQAYESTLRGTPGTVQITRAADGSFETAEVVQQPQPGETVVLTVDLAFTLELQQLVEEYMETLWQQPANAGGNATAASVVVLNVADGGVLAYANYPSYDINDYYTSYGELLNTEGNPLFNRAFLGAYRPGSTFKPVVALAGLLTGEITQNSTVYCGGTYGYYAPGYTPGCLGTHGSISVRAALQHSCNIFFYDVGRRVGQDAYNEVAEALGLGVPTGVEVAEYAGRLSNPETSEALGADWSAADVVQAAIGQLNTAVSPLQLATYAAAMANGGTRYTTHLVAGLRNQNTGETTFATQTEIAARLTDEAGAFEVVEQGMVQASQLGINRTWVGEQIGFTVASKTGSPQEPGGTNAVMIAYAPVENPEIAVAVVVEGGSNGYRAAPLVQAIFEAYYAL